MTNAFTTMHHAELMDRTEDGSRAARAELARRVRHGEINDPDLIDFARAAKILNLA